MGETHDAESGIQPWEPGRYLRNVDGDRARHSKGFLRCRPERWFPGFASQWTPLTHALGIEVRVLEVRPHLELPQGNFLEFRASIDDEGCVLRIDADGMRTLLETLGPGAYADAGDILVEYLARRFLVNLGSCWSGPQASVVRFDAKRDVEVVGGIKVGLSLNDSPVTLWIGLGESAISKLDALWRKQIQSTAKNSAGGNLHIEIAQLAVPPSMLVEYLTPGTPIDLEVLASDLVTLRLGQKPWLPARACEVDGNLALEVVPGPVQAPAALPDGTTRLVIEFGQIKIESAALAEISQVGAIYRTEMPISEIVQLAINGEKVAEATLGIYEGRFAVTVLRDRAARH